MWRISSSGRIERLVVFRARKGAYVPVGELTFDGAGKVRSGKFVYARSYLALDEAGPIDPIGLPLGRGAAAPAPGEVPLAFHDVGPDGWGKGILEQAFPSRRLSMPEFLALGGLSRTGDLAFGATPAGPETWLPGDEPLLTLPSDDDDIEALTQAAIALDQGEGNEHHLRLLLRASADVGGARPKTRLRHQGIDWIAKLPAWGDTFDEPRAEAASLDVAEAAGLSVPPRKVLSVAGRSVLLVQRFDRELDGTPFAYLSAGTLLKVPHTEYATRMTYVDIAAVARRIGVHSPEREMFRRLLVNSYLHNTDDHLRNHAVIDRGRGWELSPVFDIVPHPRIKRHVCAPAPKIEPRWSAELAFAAHGPLGIAEGEAKQIREEVVAAVQRFPECLDRHGLSSKDQQVLLGALPAELGLAR